MISCYERSLFEQQTPYLQWLRDRECERQVKEDDIKGKQIIELPFFSCEESVEACLERAKLPLKECADALRNAKFVLFYGENGMVNPTAFSLFGEYFAEHEDVAVAYADEDYLGTLQEIYGDKVVESALAKEYQYENTGLYRGFPWFKPDYSPDTLRAFFYIGNIFAVRGAVLAELLEEWKQVEDVTLSHSIYEMVLVLAEKRKYVGHIAEILYTNKNVQDTEKLFGAEDSFLKMKERVINEIEMQVDRSKSFKNTCTGNGNAIQTANADTKEKIQTLCYLIKEKSLTSIIIPSKDNSKILKRCLSTLVELTNYPHYEIILVDNGSSKQEQMCIRDCISEIVEDYDLKWADADNPITSLSVQYLYQKSEFNFSAMCNLGAKAAKGDYLLFLNDDMEIVEPTWMTRMLGQASLSHVGAVGAKLYYPKNEQDQNMPYRIQHVGITNMGIGPAHKLAGLEDKGNLYHGHNLVTYNMLAVTAACLMVQKERFWEVGGFDEALAVAYNDVELCFKLYEKGYFNVQRNDVILLHHESLSRGHDTSPEKAQRLEREKQLLYEKHPLLKAKDFFYSEHLVQWKKDVEYSCNYLYPYDKVTKPELLSKETVAKLPKEHQNKYIRKLTGENRSMLQIDNVEVSQVEENIFIQGWYVMRECDNAGIERRLLLKNTTNHEIYELIVYPKLRYDVEALFQNEAGNGKQGTKNTALSGLQLVIDKKMLTRGSYQLGMLTIEEKSLMTRKICWKKDCVFTI